MQLYSIQFAAFLVLSLICYFALGRMRPRAQWIVLLVASLAFYLSTGWQNLFFILFTSVSTWGAALTFSRFIRDMKAELATLDDRSQKKAAKARCKQRKRIVLIIMLVLNFGVMSYIKFWNSILDAFSASDSFLASHLLLPLGLSFYTFQAVGYLIDTYNGKYEADRNLAKYLLFVSFFPQLIQGPINRYDALAHQLFEPHRFEGERTRRALVLIGYGVLKKYAIADMLGPSVSACLDSITPSTPGSIIVFGILLYSAQQYTDFSGGIDMVRGVSQLFGITMAENFRQPYFSISLGDFWRRWHITLGAWMRDYVFYPFALTKPMQHLGKWSASHLGKHWGRTLPASLANILVFFLVGLWHGAEAHFIWWGLYNGIVIALADLSSPLFKQALKTFRVNAESNGWHVFRILRTFIVVNIGWYFDRILDFGDVIQAFANTMFNFAPELLLPTFFVQYDVPDSGKCLLLATLCCTIVFVISVLRERNVDVTGKILKFNVVARVAIYATVMALVLAAFMVSPMGGGFMYANF